MAEESTADGTDETTSEAAVQEVQSPHGAEWISEHTETFINYVELVAAAVFALLFAIGVGDLILQIGAASLSGTITDPQVVIGFIDTGLLLLIIVEVYQTVAAYVKQDDRKQIVRLVIYTGIIAMVRKVIIFRTGEYASTGEALFAALAYTIVIFGLVALLIVNRGR